MPVDFYHQDKYWRKQLKLERICTMHFASWFQSTAIWLYDNGLVERQTL